MIRTHIDIHVCFTVYVRVCIHRFTSHLIVRIAYRTTRTNDFQHSHRTYVLIRISSFTQNLKFYLIHFDLFATAKTTVTYHTNDALLIVSRFEYIDRRSQLLQFYGCRVPCIDCGDASKITNFNEERRIVWTSILRLRFKCGNKDKANIILILLSICLQIYAFNSYMNYSRYSWELSQEFKEAKKNTCGFIAFCNVARTTFYFNSWLEAY